MHERIREGSMAAWAAIQQGKDNPLVDILASDASITAYLSPAEVRSILARGAGVGDAPARSRELVEAIRQLVGTR
jgi:adenylosuccinate lyase